MYSYNRIPQEKNVLLNFFPLLYKSNIECIKIIQQTHRNKKLDKNQKTVTSVAKNSYCGHIKIEEKFF
jgi:hypothetical protein